MYNTQNQLNITKQKDRGRSRKLFRKLVSFFLIILDYLKKILIKINKATYEDKAEMKSDTEQTMKLE